MEASWDQPLLHCLTLAVLTTFQNYRSIKWQKNSHHEVGKVASLSFSSLGVWLPEKWGGLTNDDVVSRQGPVILSEDAVLL